MLKPSEMAKRLGVTVKTLQKWDNAGKFKAHRTPTNRRYYTEDQYLDYIGQADEPKKRRQVAYARVSNIGQKDDLTNQIDFLRQYANGKGVILDEVITDIGSGLNYKRKKWNALLDDVMAGNVETIYVTYKDRFVRFGYDWFERLAQKFNTQIVVLNNPDLSPQEELTEDLISIIHVFSSRLSGLRKYKKKIEDDPFLK
ncbi:IS607 family transposase [Lacticaseibacillus rhamnosus]|uniref:IS607 family transposase n=3 Tax=Lacticaseibacillus rhamnosus TaxID=47715 RepID=UPI00023595FC|nr:IS607 family transposase [Lacticaseibacillus rhamnosus]AGP72096.1 resolvase [Lacticaseibacillus rhamnosus LOCK900]ARD31603.1 resolvase [Lacticaseibacillus rhamnosus]EHJ21470.1 ISSoc2 resolvase [Lacticaseibacillus rhamnosus R0011]EHJ24764.1 transcriptional regulator, MerR family [Lacticaseibacillus rhamnosus ATCC 21052]MBU5979776.1 IS607 family transposase [Lacticaseibacillus rhamnosus]